MINSNKAQSSIEIIIGIFFLILFLYIFNILAEDTVKTLELNKIKEQEQEIVLSVSDFLYTGAGVFQDSKHNIIDYNASYKIPSINIPSDKPSCYLVIDDLSIGIITTYNDKNISYSVPSIVSGTSYYLPIAKTCGSEINCYNDLNKLRCI